jgi:hypothetical protein
MNEGCSNLADRIRDKLAAHDLPREQPVKTSGGYGQGHACDACDEAIQKAQVEYHIEALGNRTYRLHLGCYGRWAAEIYRERWTTTVPPQGSRLSRGSVVPSHERVMPRHGRLHT